MPNLFRRTTAHDSRGPWPTTPTRTLAVTENDADRPSEPTSGRVEALWSKRARRGPMDARDTLRLVADKGVEGDANFGRARRQVTLIEGEVFDEIRATLPDAEPVMRRANVMLSGIRLEGTRGRVLRLGDVRLHIRGETRPCWRMDAQCAGLTAALDPNWNGGVFSVVLDNGEIRVGDEVRWEGALDAG